jgi:hypothetical protein
MTDWQMFVEQFGPWVGLFVYVILKDAIPFATRRWLPSKIQQIEDERRLAEEDVEWRRRVEGERLTELKEIASATRALSISMTQTNERIATIMSNQNTIMSKQDLHHDGMMDAIGDMRAAVARREGEDSTRK